MRSVNVTRHTAAVGALALAAAGAAACEQSSRPAGVASGAAPVDRSVPRAVPARPIANEPAVPPGEAGERRGLPLGTGIFPPEVYRERRARVMREMRHGVALLFGAESLGEERRQDADFYYLTGVEDDGAALLLVPDEPVYKEYLFLKSRDPEAERWSAERLPLGHEVELRTGIARVMRAGGLPATLAQLAQRHRELVFLGPVVGYDSPPPRALDVLGKVAARVPGAAVKNHADLVARLRMAKEPREIELLKRVVGATADGHLAAMRAVHAGLHEFELKDVFEAAFKKAGARREAYGAIVGSGPNAALLHYPMDERTMRDGELVLCDVGAEMDGYASDITRTLPVSGKFTPEQRKLYEIVLRAQEAGIAAVRPGARLREDIHDAAKKVIDDAGYGDAFIHGIGHHVGLEVHDHQVSSDGLPVGAVITVEPGIYLPDKKLGIRIEDMVLVTATGHEVLSAGLPRTVDQIEAAMAARR